MDSLITAAALALTRGDVLGALNRVALRDDAPALALRGIAMARLGDLGRAKALLRSAARGFGARETVARARCIVAEAEIALVSRDLGWPPQALEDARAILAAHGDLLNAAHARHLAVRRLLLVGRLEEARRMLDEADAAPLPPAWQAAQELARAGIALRGLQPQAARAALRRAAEAARTAAIPALTAEVERAALLLAAPAARLIARDAARPLLLDDVAAVLASGVLVVDACRHVVRAPGIVLPLATRPVLFALLRTLAECWPGDAPRALLLARAVGAKVADESHRARLRVEIGRLRSAVRALAEVRATPRGFALAPRADGAVVVLAPPVEGPHAALLGLLSDGEAWSSSALAIALDASARTVQRALLALAAAGSVQPVGSGRSRRWMAPPMPGFPTALLLPGRLPID